MRIFFSLFVGLAAVVIGDGVSSSLYGQSLRYDWQPGQEFSYRFEISVETVDATTNYKGITNYTVDAVEQDQLKVTYHGGLRESTKRKRRSGFPGGFGRFGGPHRMPSPFGRPSFAGNMPTTNKIAISPRGSVVAMEGDSQIPYLLGNVSLIPFESLPAADQKEWTMDSGIAITEKNDSRRGHFGPFSPFGSNEKGSVQSASEVTRYQVLEKSGDQIKVSRTYEMRMPKSGDGASFNMSGTGTWSFDTKEHIPHSLDMNYKLTVIKGGTTTTVPISVKYSRVSPAELAELAAEAKRKAEERAAALAAAKKAAETPLTIEEKRIALSVLGGKDSRAKRDKLSELSRKTLKDPDPEVASAIEALLKHPDPNIANIANIALLKWSESYRLKKTLAKSYEGPGSLKSTDRVVESITPLYVGQIVQAQRSRYGNTWVAAKVQELMPDGKVRLGFLRQGKVSSSEIAQRRNIQLAPDALDQPSRPKPVAVASTSSPIPQGNVASSDEARTWSDATGRFKVKAVFVSSGDGTVNIRRVSDNRVLPIPISKLSKADQKYLQDLDAAENPFAIP